MEVKTTPFEGLLLLEDAKFADKRGYFMEIFKESKLKGVLGDTNFAQDNLSWSHKGVIRGLHFQVAPFAQAKLIRCVVGKIWDCVVDLRPTSKTFGRWHSVVLDGAQNQSLFVPEGFAHGFQALEGSLVSYRATSEYAPACERGIRFDDPELGIDWPVKVKTLSPKDLELPFFSEVCGTGLKKRSAATDVRRLSTFAT